MNRSDLKKFIKRAALAQMPDVFDRIDLQNAYVAGVPEQPTRRVRPFNYAFALKAMLVLILATVTGVFVYDQLQPEPPVVLALETEAEIYGFQMVSATSLLSQITATDLALTVKFGDHDTTTAPIQESETLITDQIEKITDYLNTMEVMLAEDDETVYEVTPSDVDGYQWKLTFTTVDLLGNVLTYTIYYNEVLDPEDASRRLIDGVMTMSGDEYSLSGTVTTEGDTVRTRFIAARGDDSIEITDLTDADGQKYQYDVTKDGQPYESLHMQLSREDGALVATIDHATATSSAEYRFRRLADGSGFEITYRYEKNGETETGRMGVTVEYDEVSEGYNYQYDVEAQTGSHQGHSSHSGGRTSKTNGSSDHGMNTSFTL
ncbi:MAG TPA: hypothetical protein DCR44_02100 [Acholeplasmatales bacterium]|nr:MAG: hypothetical protein A2Y16_03660 [Tenericutes bacterium GWF2_57_13]HAQ56184.1 hypothetical protein [Acholeplasmatales bacterium]